MKRSIIYIFVTLNMAVTLFFWWFGSSTLFLSGESHNIFIALGRLFGLTGELLILTQLVLVGRIRVIEQEFGHDRMNRLHHLVGLGTAVFLPLHPIFLAIGYAGVNQISFLSQILDFILQWEDVYKAVLGLLILITVVVISINVFKSKLKYETWYFTHLLMYAALALLFTHQVNSGDVSMKAGFYYWYSINFFIFGSVLLYRFLRPVYLFFRHDFKIEKIIKETENVNSVYISGKRMNDFKFQAGQFANLTFLSKNMWYTHPFSFSESYNGKHLRFSIKSVGDFTAKIKDLRSGTRVIIDGPLGVFTERKSSKDKYLFIAGGIGITPIRSLIESLRLKGKDTILLYANKTEEETTFKNEINLLNVPYHLIFSGQKYPKHEYGYVDMEKIKRLVPDVYSREIYVCGPVPMMTFVVGELLRLGIEKKYIHFEKFEY